MAVIAISAWRTVIHELDVDVDQLLLVALLPGYGYFFLEIQLVILEHGNRLLFCFIFLEGLHVFVSFPILCKMRTRLD